MHLSRLFWTPFSECTAKGPSFSVGVWCFGIRSAMCLGVSLWTCVSVVSRGRRGELWRVAGRPFAWQAQGISSLQGSVALCDTSAASVRVHRTGWLTQCKCCMTGFFGGLQTVPLQKYTIV